MCLAAAAVPYAIAALSVATTAYSSHQQAKAQNKQVEAEIENAKNAQVADFNALTEQAQQVADRGADEKLARQREALRERARMRVENGGLEGNVINTLLNKSALNEEYDKATIDKNTEAYMSQNAREWGKIGVANQNRMRSAKASWISSSKGRQSMLISGINSGLQGYALGKGLTSATS